MKDYRDSLLKMILVVTVTGWRVNPRDMSVFPIFQYFQQHKTPHTHNRAVESRPLDPLFSSLM